MEATKSHDNFGKVLTRTITRNPIVFLLLIAAIVVGCIVENFFSWGNLSNLMSNTAVRFLIALGVSGCLITKGTDLSAGRQVGFAAVVAGILCQRRDYNGRLWKFMPEMNIGLVFVIVVLIGMIWGLINGLVVSKLHVPPFIATLGTQTIIYGISLVISDAQPIGGFQKIYTTLINGRIGDVKGFYLPYLMFVALLFGVVFWFIYNKMRFGKYMYAIGGNDIAAEVSGVNTTRTLMRIYITAGIMYAVAGYLLAAKSGGASASMGQGYELEAIAGCTIGGVSTTGGIGTVPGILVGVLVFELLKIILQFLGVNPYYNYVVQGLVIVLAVAMDIRKYIAKK
ncbi:MAG: beta-methylgalactoside transporter [Clostridia bacterium]|nr:beta-methylgalactoside transporter [Clostridia bacterium]